ncbi:MAG: L-2-amino-thiazoline-4-carboxylic acid hydrolase [Candidatus Lernaella stagnicola]|nr:L-2-amino-thiazoline-4-carboxylic acid hydrolase [Candidatus Lernaella stagnicola]
MSFWKDQLRFELRNTPRSLRLLARRLGLVQTLAVTAELAAHQAIGRPWRGYPPPTSKKEKASRKQAGPAILLYQILKRRFGDYEALDITGEIVTAGAVEFLSIVVPVVRPEDYENVPQAEQLRRLTEVADRFPNGDIAPPHIEADLSFGYDVVRCHFPELFKMLGVPELAPLFCRGDKIFFDRHQPYLEMRRTTTIAEGGEVCDFRFFWK